MKAKDIQPFSIISYGGKDWIFLFTKGNMAFIKSTFTGQTMWVGLNRIIVKRAKK